MPHPKSKVLSDDDAYALTAYILNINEFEIDGEEVDDEYVLDREKFLKVVMPNVDGFEPNIDGPNALNDIRTYYANPKNFGAVKVKRSERKMKDCQNDTVKIKRVQNGGIKDFLPPMSDVRDLPKDEKTTLDVKSAYADNCAMCHGNGVGPGFGSSADWKSYTADGMDKVYALGIKGIGGMPAKGGSSLSDVDFKSVVDYLINGK
jgi:cytochrome c